MKAELKPAHAHTPYHPRWYRPRVSTYWWLGRWPYLMFIVRELSSVFVAWAVVLNLLLLRALLEGPQSYADFQQWVRSPVVLAGNVVSFFFLLVHTVTWFNLAPHALGLRVRGKRVPAVAIAGPNYVLWLVVSALVAWFILKR